MTREEARQVVEEMVRRVNELNAEIRGDVRARVRAVIESEFPIAFEGEHAAAIQAAWDERDLELARGSRLVRLGAGG